MSLLPQGKAGDQVRWGGGHLVEASHLGMKDASLDARLSCCLASFLPSIQAALGILCIPASILHTEPPLAHMSPGAPILQEL